MENNDFAAKYAYTKAVAAAYETDRKGERIWKAEQAYVKSVVEALPKTAYLLDLPVGTGRFFDFYRDNATHVHGSDISEHMLSEARAKLNTESLIDIALGDVTQLKYGNNTFTHLICFRLLHLIPKDKLECAIKELARVTSGELHFQAYIHDGWFPLLRVASVISKLGRKVLFFRDEKLPWGHIESFLHRDKYVLELFKAAGLILIDRESLGFYGTQHVVVYKLRKT